MFLIWYVGFLGLQCLGEIVWLSCCFWLLMFLVGSCWRLRFSVCCVWCCLVFACSLEDYFFFGVYGFKIRGIYNLLCIENLIIRCFGLGIVGCFAFFCCFFFDVF